MESTRALNQEYPPQGYTVAYEREEIQFPVYVVAFISVFFGVAGYALDNIFLIALALLGGGFAYHNFPLLETGRPRIGAGQYGIFADGLGIISWRAIKRIELVPVEFRGSVNHELRIALQEPLDKALIADWRKRPFHRFLMRLPWTAFGGTGLRIPLDVFDRPADQIHHNFTRMMAFYQR